MVGYQLSVLHGMAALFLDLSSERHHLLGSMDIECRILRQGFCQVETLETGSGKPGVEVVVELRFIGGI